jgi:nucleoid-associated protein
MTIRDWSVQELQKLTEEDVCQCRSPENRINSGADSESFCHSLKRLFMAKPGKGYGGLQMFAEHSVCGPLIKEWYEQKIPFFQLVSRAITTIKEKIDIIPLLTHSYCIWVHDQQGDSRFLYFFIIESSITQIVTDAFSIEPIEHLDPQALSFGIKIDLNLLFTQTQESQNIAVVFLQRQRRKLAEAACHAFGFVSKINTTEETTAMLSGIERYAAAMGLPQAREFKKRAVEFCQEQENLGEPVDIEELSMSTNTQQPQHFAQFFRQELPESPAKLHPDSRKLKQLIRFAGRNQGVSLSFSADAINQSVVYNPEQDTLVITDIPKSLKAQLQRYIKQQQHEN